MKINTKKLGSEDEYYAALQCHHIVFDDFSNFREFMFEYAITFMECQGVKPDRNTDLIPKVITSRLYPLYILAQQLYRKYTDSKFHIPFLEMEKAREIARKEQKSGIGELEGELGINFVYYKKKRRRK